ncbi:MAG: ATP-binding protein [Eubacterium sp.]|nr:ATP-binding protein [Eubacterium sp.]
MTEIRKLPIGIQSFEKLRDDNYLYVDKTKYIWDLVNQGGVYFLSRPRRFGKSLLLTTMEAYFRGRKNLFKGLYIEKKENEKAVDAWQEHPVIKFSLAGGEYLSPDGLYSKLDSILKNTSQEYGISYDEQILGTTLSVRFSNLLALLCKKTGRRVVVLVDEYDKPLLETMIKNPDQEEKNRELYKGFFAVLKDQDEFLEFVFFTGVTKFTKVSIFSDLNQLTDISLDSKYACICGITEEELLGGFGPEIGRLARKNKETQEECQRHLEKMYDGYHFASDSPGVYNPFSLLNALRAERYGRYWFSTGTPTMLIEKLETSSINPEDLDRGVEATEQMIEDYRAENPDPIPLFYQSGYLTIKHYDDRFATFILGYPNEEVKYGFLNSLIPAVLGYRDEEHPLTMRNMVLDLETGDADSFLTRLKSLFAGIPYPATESLKYEESWRNQIYLILTLLGAFTSCEVQTSEGRCDCVAETSDYIYIFEFKMDKSADEALAQIDDRGYGIRYEADGRKLMKIGVAFSSEERTVTGWKIA